MQHPFLLLPAVLLTPPLAAQVPSDSTVATSSIQAIVAALPPAIRVRIATRQDTLVGRVTDRSTDSLTVTLRGSGGNLVVGLADIDSLWVPARKGMTGTLVGASIGALVAIAALSHSPGDDPGLNEAIAGIALGGGILVGMVIDSSGESWIRRFP